MILETEQLRAAVLMARAANLNAEVAGMVAENMQRAAVGHSMAYDEKAFVDAIARNMLGENGVIQMAIHGDTT